MVEFKQVDPTDSDVQFIIWKTASTYWDYTPMHKALKLPYRIDMDYIRKLAKIGVGRVLFGYDNDEVVAIFVGGVDRYIWSKDDYMLFETVFWIHPDYRNRKTFITFMKEIDSLAVPPIKFIQMQSFNSKLTRSLKMNGYKPIEEILMKKIGD